MTDVAGAAPVEPDEIDLRQAGLPPVARLATLTLALVVAGGIIMAAQLRAALRHWWHRWHWPSPPA